MSKFNQTKTRVSPTSPVVSQSTPTGLTYEGAPGYARDAKSELFLLAVSNMVGENTFYEKASDRDERYERLVHQVAVADPDWTRRFLGWLRAEGNMRSASLVGALEAARALVAAGIPGARPIVASVLQRADEPGEALAYWTSRYGRSIPKPVKRGIADAVQRLYNEYGLLKYDTASKGFRFADVIDLTHPSPYMPWQGDLFQVALERRHGRDGEIPLSLPMLVANQVLRETVASGDYGPLLSTSMLHVAGMTWEDVLSLAGSEVNKAALWEAIIPSMGYMALLRNLRNFDEAGVSDQVAETVAARLSNPDQVARSRQFPYRFLAAYEQAPSLRWGPALDKALNLSLANVPKFNGRTLVLIDTSASMQGGLSAKSKMTPGKAAAIFGVVLAARCGADVYGFADGVFRHDVSKVASVIREADRFMRRTGEVGHGTKIAQSLQRTFSNHDRVFVISDMQTMDSGTSSAVPGNIPLYGFNLGGYRHGAYTAGFSNRHEFGGLTDATFKIIPVLEAGQNGTLPF